MSTPPPIIRVATPSIRGPSLIGITDDGLHIDLDRAKVEWHPAQQMTWSWSNDDIRLSDQYPQTYSMTFTKPLKSPWVKWFNDNLDVRFKVWQVRFSIESMETLKAKVRYRVTGFLSI